MTNPHARPRQLTAVPEAGTPEGVEMWTQEPGAGLPQDCPVSSGRFTVAPGAVTDVDVHDVVEVWTVTSGQGTVLSQDRRMQLGRGESVFFPSRVDHRMANETDEPVEVFTFWWSRGAR